MRSILTLILPLLLSSGLYSATTDQGEKQLTSSQNAPSPNYQQPAKLSAEEEYEEDDTGEVDEDIIIQDEEDTNDDEGVHN